MANYNNFELFRHKPAFLNSSCSSKMSLAEKLMKKRERGANYTEEDKALLADLVMQYKDIIEDKNTSAIITNKKKQAWKAVTAKYNSKCISGPRDTDQLKTKYDNMKQIARRHVNDNAFRNKTGNAIPTLSKSEINLKILSIIQDQVESHSNPYDSGASYFKDEDRLEDECIRQEPLIVPSENQNNYNDSDYTIEDPLITVPKVELVNSPVSDHSDIPEKNNLINRIRTKNKIGVPFVSKKIKNNASADTLKRIYFKRKCENASLERKKLMMEMIYMKREHTMKMKVLTKQLENNN